MRVVRCTGVRRQARAWTVAAGLLVLSAACSTPADVHPVQRVVVGTLHVDARSGCSWVVERSGVVETLWVDGTRVDRSRQPVGLRLDGHRLAQDGQSVQAVQSSGVTGKPIVGCPTPSGTEKLSVYRLQVRPPAAI